MSSESEEVGYGSVTLYKEQVFEYRKMVPVTDSEKYYESGQLALTDAKLMDPRGEEHQLEQLAGLIAQENKPAKKSRLARSSKAPPDWLFKFWSNDVVPNHAPERPAFIMAGNPIYLETFLTILPNASFKLKGKWGFRSEGLEAQDEESYFDFSIRVDLKEFLPTAEDGVESPNRLYIHVLDSPISRVDLKKRNGKFAFAHLNYIKLQWPLENMRKLVKGDGQNQLRRSVLWKMFERESSKDVTIVAGNGVELKCHGAILEGHSPVFAAMLDDSGGMIESQSRRVDMSEFSEEALKLLLQFVYTRDIFYGSVSCDLSLELLQLGHRYELKMLQEAIVKLVLRKEAAWFTPDVVIEFYFFLRNLDIFKELETKLFQIMNEIQSEIRVCDKYKQLPPSEGEGLERQLKKFSRAKRSKLE